MTQEQIDKMWKQVAEIAKYLKENVWKKKEEKKE